MDEQLDNELKKRIQQVFENFEDTTADEGWLLLREKFPEKESKRRGLIWLWWGSAAAILFIFLGIGLWYFNKNDASVQQGNYSAQSVKHNQPQSVVTAKKVQTDTLKSVQSAAGQKQSQIAGTSNKKSSIEQGTNQQAKQNHGQVAAIKTAGNGAINKSSSPGSKSNLYSSKSGLIAKNKATSQQTNVNSDKQGSEKSYQQALAGSTKQNTGKTNKKALLPLPAGTDKTTQESLAANNETDNANNPVSTKPQGQITASTKTDTAATNKIAATPKPAKKTIADMFAEDKQITSNKKKDDTKTNEKRVHFGVYAATYFSYAKGSADEVNMGAGFSSDIKISNNLKLVTGVAIGQNTLSYPGTSSVDAAASPYSFAPSTNVAAAYLNYAQAATPSIKNYNANLVGLDIPLNLKYEINPKKSDTYILAGLSSGTFINESYTYFYNYPALNSSTLQQTQGATTSKSFNSFYFAKTLNLAFGVGYPIGNNHLVIEPFLKYPLEGLGSQQIRFGAGGINLKFNFLPKK